jgi:hypothetical protein
MYHTNKDAFIAGYASANEASPDIPEALIGTEKAHNACYSSREHAYLSGARCAKLLMMERARAAFVSATKDSYLAAKAVTELTGYMATYQANAEGRAAKAAKAEWKEAERAAIAARDIASKI